MARFDVTSIRDRLNISGLAIRFSWLTICGWVAVAVVGVFAFGSLKYALFPDITFPVVVVNATAAIETPLATETRLTTPIERQLQPLADLKRTASSTTAGRTVINLRFRVGTALAEATTAVEQALEQVALPPSADYEVIPLNLNEATAVTYALLSETRSLAELAELTEETVLPPLQEIAGVLRVNVLGTGTRSDDSNGDFLAALQQSPTRVRFDGTAALALQVVKQGQANPLEVVDRVAEALGQIQADLPEVQFILA
ncbi:MAG: efflux RND transporter permease subunit, partial [Cyanobacteria bacterium P01_G01_bin.38]